MSDENSTAYRRDPLASSQTVEAGITKGPAWSAVFCRAEALRGIVDEEAPRLPAICSIAARSPGKPYNPEGTMQIALLRSSRTSAFRSRSRVLGSTSQSLITSPARATADGTEKQVYAGITTSRRFEPCCNAWRKTASAARPEETRNGFWVPRRPRRSSTSPRSSPELGRAERREVRNGNGAPAGATRRNRLKECFSRSPGR